MSSRLVEGETALLDLHDRGMVDLRWKLVPVNDGSMIRSHFVRRNAWIAFPLRQLFVFLGLNWTAPKRPKIHGPMVRVVAQECVWGRDFDWYHFQPLCASILTTQNVSSNLYGLYMASEFQPRWLRCLGSQRWVLIYMQNAKMAFLLLSWPLSAVVWSSFAIHHKVSGFYNSRTVWHRIS